MLQCPRVVQPQVLHVQHRQAAILEQPHQLADGGHVTAREDPFLDPGVDRARPVAADGVDQADAVGLQGPPDDAGERRVIVGSDVLQHADRHKGVAVAGDVAIVVLDEFDAVREALAVRLLARPGQLLTGNIEGAHPHAMLLRHVARQSAPAAAGFDHLLSGLQSQLAADVLELGELGLLEAEVRRLEVGAGVLHRSAVEPLAIEVVAQVVVAMDVVARVGEVGAAPRAVLPEAAQPGGPGPAGALQMPVDLDQHVAEVAVHPQAAGAEQLAKADGRALQQLE